MTTSLVRSSTSSSLLAYLIESPNLAQTVQALPKATFAALVRRIGLEDAGEIVSLATTEQLVAAFDEDLFVNARPGEREAFSSAPLPPGAGDGEFVKGDGCGACTESHRCYGVRRGYAELYGTTELRPFTTGTELPAAP